MPSWNAYHSRRAWLAHGMTEEEILDEHPGLEKQDFAAVYAFAAEMTDQAYSYH